MIRRAFTMRLKPGAMAKYRYHHDNIWPELLQEIEKSGIARFYTFERDPDLFLFSEIIDQDAWDRLWHSEVHTKWGKVMEPLMNFRNGIVDFGELREIFRCETKLGRPATLKAKPRNVPKKKSAKAKSKPKAKAKKGKGR